MNCNYCNKEFSSKSNLTIHQKSARYCLDIQGKVNENFKCKYCEKIFTYQQNLNEHFNSCKQKKKLELSEKEQKLLDKIEEKESVIQNLLSEKDKEIQDLLDVKEKETQRLLAEKDKQIARLEEMLKVKDKAIMDIAFARFNSDNETYSIPENDIEEESDSEECDAGNPASQFEQVKTPTDLVLNSVTVCSREDGYVNATQICQAGNKKFSHWFQLESTKELIKALESDAGIPASQLVEVNRGQSSKFKQGSWIHPDLAIQLAQWINPTFALHVSKWIRTLFNDGSVKVDLKTLKDKDLEIKMKDHRIKILEDKCLSKQKRVTYPEKNVIYLLTTKDHFQKRTYILGKAKDLKNRLSTYNKTCDHEVVYYRECKTENDMNVAEILIMNKLGHYREQANRERFILPEDKEISFFKEEIDLNIDFINSKYVNV